MIQRAMTVARGHVCTLRNGLQDVGVSQTHRIRQDIAQCQERSNRRRQSATCSVDVVARDAWRLESFGVVTLLNQHINNMTSKQMTSFEQHRLTPYSEQILRSGGQSLGVRNVTPQEQSGLVQIRCDHARTREQLAHQHLYGCIRHQSITTARHHHRVKHNVGQFVMVNGPCHNLHTAGRGQHANLDSVDANVFHHGLNLYFQKLVRHRVNALHADGVLRSQRGNGTRPVATQGRKSFQVGLNACTTATIRASNGEDACIAVRVIHKRHYLQTPKDRVQ